MTQLSEAPSVNSHVSIAGKLFLYEAKAPFERSGKSLKGAIEYDPETGEMRCHECGVNSTNLAMHIKVHKIKAAQYKTAHGLKFSTALVSDARRKAISDASRRREGMIDAGQAASRMALMRKHWKPKAKGSRSPGVAEAQNHRGSCRVQTLEKISSFAATTGRPPTRSELEERGVSHKDIEYHFGNYSNAAKLCGLMPNKGRSARFSEDVLIRQLRIFYHNHQRIPRVTDCNRGFFICGHVPFYKRFGSWRNAIEVAFSPREIVKDGFWAKAVQSPHRHPASAAAFQMARVDQNG